MRGVTNLRLKLEVRTINNGCCTHRECKTSVVQQSWLMCDGVTRQDSKAEQQWQSYVRMGLLKRRLTLGTEFISSATEGRDGALRRHGIQRLGQLLYVFHDNLPLFAWSRQLHLESMVFLVLLAGLVGVVTEGRLPKLKRMLLESLYELRVLAISLQRVGLA